MTSCLVAILVLSGVKPVTSAQNDIERVKEVLASLSNCHPAMRAELEKADWASVRPITSTNNVPTRGWEMMADGTLMIDFVGPEAEVDYLSYSPNRKLDPTLTIRPEEATRIIIAYRDALWPNIPADAWEDQTPPDRLHDTQRPTRFFRRIAQGLPTTDTATVVIAPDGVLTHAIRRRTILRFPNPSEKAPVSKEFAAQAALRAYLQFKPFDACQVSDPVMMLGIPERNDSGTHRLSDAQLRSFRDREAIAFYRIDFTSQPDGGTKRIVTVDAASGLVLTVSATFGGLNSLTIGPSPIKDPAQVRFAQGEPDFTLRPAVDVGLEVNRPAGRMLLLESDGIWHTATLDHEDRLWLRTPEGYAAFLLPAEHVAEARRRAVEAGSFGRDASPVLG